jgi:hypothetical protein
MLYIQVHEYCTQDYNWKSQTKPIGNYKRTKPRCRRLDNIENNRKETVCENVGWIDITVSLKGK